MAAAIMAGSTLIFSRPFPRYDTTMTALKHRLSLADEAVIDAVVPFRSESDLRNDLECFRDEPNRRHIHFVHMRKAGGTDIVSILKKEHEKPGGERIHYFHSEGLTFNVSCIENDDPKQGGMIHLTSLRDPLQRIISSYFYEGRFVLRWASAHFSCLIQQSEGQVIERLLVRIVKTSSPGWLFFQSVRVTPNTHATAPQKQQKKQPYRLPPPARPPPTRAVPTPTPLAPKKKKIPTTKNTHTPHTHYSHTRHRNNKHTPTTTATNTHPPTHTPRTRNHKPLPTTTTTTNDNKQQQSTTNNNKQKNTTTKTPHDNHTPSTTTNNNKKKNDNKQITQKTSQRNRRAHRPHAHAPRPTPPTHNNKTTPRNAPVTQNTTSLHTPITTTTDPPRVSS